MITWGGVLTTVIATLGAFGGAAAIATVVAKWVSDHASKQLLQTHKAELDKALETHKAELARESDSHKLTLKRQELIYQRELEAADALMALWRAIYPQYRFPDMEWDDACEDVAGRLHEIEKLLGDFLEKHSIAISADVREKLEHLQTVASTEKFYDPTDDAMPRETIKAGGEIINTLREARDQVLQHLQR